MIDTCPSQLPRSLYVLLLQDFVEETAEFQVGIDDSKRRKMRLTTRKTIIAGNEVAISVHEELKCYCKCMQVMLQASSSLHTTDYCM